MMPWIFMQGAGSLDFEPPASSSDHGTTIPAERAIAKCFDPTTNALKCVDTGAASGNTGTKLNYDQIWQDVFDPTNTAVRITFV